jgi:hypothetical protein
MIKKSKIFFKIILAQIGLLVFVAIYLFSTKTINKKAIKEKIQFVKLTKLPDLAILTNSTYIRRRSLSDTFSIFKDDGNLRQYGNGSFVYTQPNILKNTPSRIVDVEK